MMLAVVTVLSLLLLTGAQSQYSNGRPGQTMQDIQQQLLQRALLQQSVEGQSWGRPGRPGSPGEASLSDDEEWFILQYPPFYDTESLEDVRQLLQRALLQQSVEGQSWLRLRFPNTQSQESPGQTMQEDREQLLQRALLQKMFPSNLYPGSRSQKNPQGPDNDGTKQDVQQLLQRALLQQLLARSQK